MSGGWKGFPILLAFIVLGCRAGKSGESASDPERVQRVILKFQDSTGWVERILPADSLGPNLRAYVAALRAAPDSGRFKMDSKDASAEIWQEFLQMDHVACGCESPSDSLEMVFGDGRREKYQMYCSVALKVGPDTSRPLRIDQIGLDKLSNRWDALRLQYCPKPFGCGDVPSPGWRTGIQRLADSAWLEFYMAPRELGDSLEHLIERMQDPEPEVGMLVTLHVRGRMTERITVDSVGARYAELADTLAARGLSERVPLEDGPHRFRLIAFNYFLEK